MQPDSFTEIIFLLLAVATTMTTTMIFYVATAMIFYMVHRMVCLVIDRSVSYVIDRMICFPVLGMHRVLLYHIVLLLAAFAYERLVMMTFIHYILVMVYLVSQPWIRVIDHYLVAVVEIISGECRRQTRPPDPCAAFIIHKDMSGHVIVGVYIRQVVVVDVVIAYRSPYRLHTDIDGYRNLCCGLMTGQYAHQEQGEEC